MGTLTFRHPRLVALILLVLVSAGLSSLLSLGRQEDPTITNLFATITTPFPGADPARVEALVTSEIEEELRKIAEVDVIESVSRPGVSVISVELLQTLDEATIEQVWSEARDAVEDARRNFPAGVQPPEFDAEGISAYSAVIAVSPDFDDIPLSIVHDRAETLADRLRNIPSTRAVDLFGEPAAEILVEVDPGKAVALGLSPADIARLIEAADGKVQAGRLQNRGLDLTVNISGEIDALDRLGRVVLRKNEAGAGVLLADVATITRAVSDPPDELAFANGRPAVLVAVLAQEGVQIDRWMRFLRDELNVSTADLPHGLSQTLLFDQSTYTADRLTEVGVNMAIGVGLVVAVLFITLGLRAAAIVAVVLPVVTLATLASMNFMGLPVHQMSVTGLIVALGLLVDAAIVMVDEVRQRLARNMTRLDAVSDASRRLAAPLLASTVTTALSFTPMILLPGPAGDFVGAIAIAVVLMLVWSFLVAVTVTPALAGHFLKDGARAGVRLPVMEKLFQNSLRWSLSHPLKSISLALILPFMGFGTFPALTAQFFPGVERDQFYIEVEMPPGTAIERTAEVVGAIDRRLMRTEGIDRAYWSVGRSGPAFYYNIVSGRSSEPGYAQAMVTTTDAAAAARIVPALQTTLNAAHPGARIIVRDLVQGPPVSAPVEVRLVGPDLTVLRSLGDQARTLMTGLPLVTQVRSAVTGGAPQLRFDIDEGAARHLGMNVTDVAAQLEAGLAGVTGGSLVEGTDQIPIRVRYNALVRGNYAAMADLPILLPDAPSLSAGGLHPAIPLSEIASPAVEPAESVITRRNGERTNTIQAYIVPGILPEEALQSVLAAMADAGFSLPAGYRMELGGDSDARSDTVGNLLASVGLIVTLTIATIALTFNSFRLTGIALIVTVLSAGLSFLSLAIMQFPFGITAIIGVIGSIGVSINAAIIILTGLKSNDRAASGNVAAMADVVGASSRHIISTTITTFGGFLPLILAGGGFWPPFAVAIAGGVLLSAVVSFYFVPPMFALIYARPGRSEKAAGAENANLCAPNAHVVKLAAE